MKKLRVFASTLLFPVFIFICCFVFAMFQGGFVSWFLFYSMVPFLLYPFLLRVFAFKDVEAIRRLKQKEFLYGESVEIELTVRRKGRLPLLFVVVEDLVPERFKGQLENRHKCVRFPLWRQDMTFSYRIPAVVRGEHHFAGVRLTTSDFLGFYKKEIEVKCFSGLLVYPQYDKVTHKSIEALYEQGQRLSAVKNLKETNIIAGVRQYIPGDRMSWIHWKATARKNEVMTKEFEETKNLDVVLLLDQEPSPLFEELVSFAASSAYSFLRKGLGVAYAGTAGKTSRFIMGRGEQQRQRILYELAKVDTDQEHTLENFVERGVRNLPSQVILMIITSRFSEKLLGELNAVKGKAGIIVVVVKEQLSAEENESVLLENHFGVQCAFVTPGSRKSTVEEVKVYE